jgi:hypothetical protein
VAASIVSSLLSILTPDIVGKLATATNLEDSSAQTAIAAAVPLMLSALAGLVDQAGGAKQLAKAVATQPAGRLSSISSDLTANNLTKSTYMAVKGASILASLLGSGAFSTLAATVAQFADIREGSSRSLIGLITPLIMGVLDREQRAADLNANALAKLLSGQRSEFTAAMPSGLDQLLEASRLREDNTSRAKADSGQPAPLEALKVAAGGLVPWWRRSGSSGIRSPISAWIDLVLLRKAMRRISAAKRGEP